MKRVMLFAVMLFLALGASRVLAEEHHVVSKGETLWSIGGVHWRDIQKANGLKSETIYIGQKLFIPDSHVTRKVHVKKELKKTVRKPVWRKVGANPYRGTARWAIEHSRLPEEVKVAVLRNIKENKFQWYERGLQTGQHLDWMTFGKNQVEYDLETAWESGEAYSAKNFGVDGYVVLYVEKCHNWGGWREEALPPQTAEVPQEALPSGPFPGQPFPGVTPAEVKTKNRDTWDWYVGAGNYQSRIQPSGNHGSYYWTKFRVRPFWYDVSSNVSIGIGFEGFLAGGHGQAVYHYDYDWNERVFGATAKIIAPHKDFDIDAGVGKLYNKGRWMGQEVNRQTDDVLLFSFHGNFYERRDQGKVWFPKGEGNAEGRFPFSTKLYAGQKTNNQVVDLSFTQWIYDMKVNGNDSFVVTPGVNVGVGHEWSSSDPNYLQTGPAVEFSSYGNVIAAVSIMNYKFQGTGQWQPINAYVSLDGAYNAWQASQIVAASPADLNLHLPDDGASQLLSNPADYLK